MSLCSKIAVSCMLAIKKSGLIKGPGTDLDAEIAKAKAFNRRHAYKEPRDHKASYKTTYISRYPCLEIIPRNYTSPDKAILFLHGGGIQDDWKPEIAFARTYGKYTGMKIFYPMYPPSTEASLTENADLILQVYRTIVKEYGAENVAVIGNSYGGFLAMQLLTWINRSNADSKQEPIGMPGLLIMNSPFSYPKTPEEWIRAKQLEQKDPMIAEGAFRFMLSIVRKMDPDTPNYVLYPWDMDFRNAPETYVYYTEEACSAVANGIRSRYEQDGAGDRLHMHMEPGMMHCYACAPIFKESRRDFSKQIRQLRLMSRHFVG